MIPKSAIDQAISIHTEEVISIRVKALHSLEAEWKALEAGYTSADKSCKDKIKAINKDRVSRRDTAQKNYLRDSHKEEGSSFTTFEEQSRSIDNDCNEQMEQAKTARENTNRQHEERYKMRVRDILDKYNDAMASCIEKFIAAMPVAG